MIIENGKKYDIRLIPQTLTRENAIKEIVGALDHLNSISDEIFSTIRTRLNNHKKQVESLNSRVSLASEQISALKGSQKAIRIISPAKYPCEITSSNNGGKLEEMTVTFPALVGKYIEAPPVMGEEEKEEPDSEQGRGHRRPFRFDACIKHPSDLTSIFHVKEPKNVGDLTQLDNVSDVGLGRPPNTIRNMDSFFLFNTFDNPYQNYKMTDRSLQDRNFGTLRPFRKGEEVQPGAFPLISPTEIDSNAEAKKTEVDDFYYNPSALEIPDIDVPESLPDLPGIAESFDLADDLLSPTFSSKSFSLSNAPSLKTVQNSSAITAQGQRSRSSSIFQEQNDFTSQQQSQSLFQSQPKLPTTIVPNFKPQPEEGPAPSGPVSPPSPPPPPPPPPMIPPPEKENSIKASPSMITSSGAGGDLRSSLMAAIREAGGSGKASLRSAKDRKYEAKRKKQDEKEKTISNDFQEGTDLMADLKNKLAMRRKGISGIPEGQKRPPSAVGDIMMSLAATIPTFDNSVESSGAGTAASDDDDWD